VKDVSEHYFKKRSTVGAPEPEFAPELPKVEPRLTVRTAREIMAWPEPDGEDLLLGPLVRRRTRTIIVGDTGHGKTSLAFQLGGAVLTGSEALGYTGAAVGPLLVVDLEQGLRSIKRALRDANLADRDDALYLAVPDGLALDSAKSDDRAELETALDKHKPAVVIIDPYYKAHRGDANEERAVVDLMRYLDGLRTLYGFALILPAHPRKDQASKGVRKLTLHDVAGSGAIVRGAELVLALERLSHGYARLRVLKDRDSDLTVGEACPLIFSRRDGFRLDPKEERTAEELEHHVLGDTGEWRTVKEWAQQLKIREERARELLEHLAETEHVEFMEGPPGRSSKAKCYRTSPTPRAKSGEVTQLSLGSGTAPSQPPVGGRLRGRSDGATSPESGTVVRGGEMYPRLLAEAERDGHITEAERLEEYERHKLLERARS